MLGIELIGRVGFAVLLGALIGIERQWRSGMAGLQTMALVSMGAALFVILGAYSFNGTGNPTQVVGQIVTGIGFLGAGVIMKQGLSVTGLNTAATLWATGAIGALAGAWMWREASAGAAMVIAANLFLRPWADRLDRRHFQAGREIPPTDYLLNVASQPHTLAAVRTLTIQTLSSPAFRVKSISTTGISTPGLVGLNVEVSTDHRDDAHLERAVRLLSENPNVRSVRWSIPDEAAAEWIGRRAD
jgi:putative Mg2+ transporter-C (MgtC) family protein